MTKPYKLVVNYRGENACIFRVHDNTSIPYCEDNRDYQEYLDWVAEGNTPDPAD
jgi:hypothetical protein|tara:strand:- start:477 stop:638 length:162 start_codon:yes stop_codon:yes gene_type:complete